MKINTIRENIILSPENNLDILILGNLEHKLTSTSIRYNISYNSKDEQSVKIESLIVNKDSFTRMLRDLLLGDKK